MSINLSSARSLTARFTGYSPVPDLEEYDLFEHTVAVFIAPAVIHCSVIQSISPARATSYSLLSNISVLRNRRESVRRCEGNMTYGTSLGQTLHTGWSRLRGRLLDFMAFQDKGSIERAQFSGHTRNLRTQTSPIILCPTYCP